jgi:hypothetical protein
MPAGAGRVGVALGATVGGTRVAGGRVAAKVALGGRGDGLLVTVAAAGALAVTVAAATVGRSVSRSVLARVAAGVAVRAAVTVGIAVPGSSPTCTGPQAASRINARRYHQRLFMPCPSVCKHRVPPTGTHALPYTPDGTPL